jgi:ArsR family transcriptional regulator
LNLKQVEKISKALGDHNRLKILKAIQSHKGKLDCTLIVSFLDLAQPSISHHIKKLLEAELIESHKEGRFYSYSLKEEVLNAYLDTLKKL